MKTIRIGTRGSELALIQTRLVIEAIKERYPDYHCETVILKTRGDAILDRPLEEFGGKGAFVTEFEVALMEERIDLAVHSAKDMPKELLPGLGIAGVLKREDPRDVLVSTRPLDRDGAIRVGTGSTRRGQSLKALYPKATICPVRGNVPTRLEKLKRGEYDALVLAMAGLNRLELAKESDLCYRPFSIEEMVPSCGQGIIALEGRDQDPVSEIAAAISHPDSETALFLERGIIEVLDAGCGDPVGVYSCVKDEQIEIYIYNDHKTEKLWKRTIHDSGELSQVLSEYGGDPWV